MLKIMICGYGLFGKALLERLINSGYEPKVLTQSNDKKVKLGERAIEPNKLNFDIVFGCRKTSHNICDLLDEHKIEYNKFIDLATNPPQLVSELYSEFNKRGAEYIELPQLGSSVSLRNGDSCSLILDEITKNKEVLDLVNLLGSHIKCKRKLYPCKLKLIHNYLAAWHLSIYGECMKISEILEIERKDVFEVLKYSPMCSTLLEAKSEKIINSDYNNTQFSANNMLKDLEIIKKVAGSAKAESIYNQFKIAVEKGFGNMDTSVVAEL